MPAAGTTLAPTIPISRRISSVTGPCNRRETSLLLIRQSGVKIVKRWLHGPHRLQQCREPSLQRLHARGRAGGIVFRAAFVQILDGSLRCGLESVESGALRVVEGQALLDTVGAPRFKSRRARAAGEIAIAGAQHHG